MSGCDASTAAADHCELLRKQLKEYDAIKDEYDRLWNTSDFADSYMEELDERKQTLRKLLKIRCKVQNCEFHPSRYPKRAIHSSTGSENDCFMKPKKIAKTTTVSPPEPDFIAEN